MVDVRRTNDQQILQEVTKAYPGLLLDVYVKESIKFADAPRHQRSILELDPRHDGARVSQLARLVLQHYGEWTEADIIPEPVETEESLVPPPAPSPTLHRIPARTTEMGVRFLSVRLLRSRMAANQNRHKPPRELCGCTIGDQFLGIPNLTFMPNRVPTPFWLYLI